MSLSGDDRATAQYNATPGLDKLNADEKAKLLKSLKNIYGVDTNYLTANTEVDPTSLVVQPGATLLSAGPGSPVTGTATLSGTGTIS